MAKSIEEIVNGEWIESWIFDTREPDKKFLVYRTNTLGNLVELNQYSIDENEDEDDVDNVVIQFLGFKNYNEIDCFSKLGYITSGVDYYLRKVAEKVSLNVIKIQKDISSYIGEDVFISYDDYVKFNNLLKAIKQETKNEKKICSTDFLSKLFPSEFSSVSTEDYANIKAKKVINNIDTSIIAHLKKNDIKKIQIFFQELIEKKYVSASAKSSLITETKIEVDTTTIDNILVEFEKLLSKKTSESTLGKFLMNKIFLLSGKYIHSVPEIHLTMGTSGRKVDFGLLDIHGYLDIYEIKTHNTKLLDKDQDRGNYYWHKDSIKAIVQAEKYLYNAEKNASTLMRDLKDGLERKGITLPDFDIIRPKAYLIIGHSSQLDTQPKKDDFRILRQSLKNVEIMLYDEMLESLKNQRNRFLPPTT